MRREEGEEKGRSPIPNSPLGGGEGGVPQFPIPNSQFPIPNSQFPIPNSQFPIPNSHLIYLL
ncbi:MAG: hypothetical protein WBL95_05125 [Microcoleus sp.]